MNTYKSVRHREVTLRFAVPNVLNHFRVNTFSTKEPETLAWIDSIPENSILWDVGANVGLYTCYAALSRSCMVYSFEPSVFNLELLARNVHINGLVDRVTVVPFPLSDTRKESTLNLTSVELGAALSSFGEGYGEDGKSMDKVFDYRMIGLSMDYAVEVLGIPEPDYIKIDVDGIEHLILSGGKSVLKKIKGMSIEVNENFDVQAKMVEKHCLDAGLIFIEKQHSEMFQENSRFGKTYNQIWHRPV